MPYQIKNGNIVAKGTDGDTRRFPKDAVDAIIAQCKADGIPNRYIIAGILATVSKESQFVPQDEGMNYSAKGLLELFGRYFQKGRANASEYERKPEKIGNYIYGYTFKDGVKTIGRYGNNLPGDGYKFRGRGFNQITFKGNSSDGYIKFGKLLGVDLVSNPASLNTLSNASKALVRFYTDIEKKSNKLLKSKFKKSSLNDFDNWDQALLCIINMTAGFNNPTNSGVVKWAYDNAKKCHSFLIEYLEKNPQGTIAPPENPSNVDNKAQEKQNEDQAAQQSNDTQQDSTSSDNTSNDSAPVNNGQPISNLTQFFKPTLAPTNIQFDVEASGNDKGKIAKQAGYMPFVWYNGVQISYQDILKFNLYHKGMLPVIEVTVVDSWGVLREDGFPHDDTNLSIYLNSKSLNLRSINMDFKVLDFKDAGNNTYIISGICNIPQIYLRKFLSYGSKTSHETLQEVAKQCGLGFCSNINNSDDKMTWINSGFKNIEFIENVINNSYVSETSFQYCYIDFYYNLCYMDLNKEMDRDVSQDKMVTGFGYKFLADEDPDVDEKTSTLLLSNDRSAKESIAYFSKFDIINKSTKVSLDKAYRTRTKYYDSNKKELLIFDIESQTSDGSKSIILKGAVNDEKFFEENVTSTYVGKLDSFDDGKGNVHKNFNYSIPQNRQNLDDITKVSCVLTLPSNNFNLYVYQKVPIYFSPQKQTPTIENDFYKRISGDWLITGIEFDHEGGKSHQIVKAIKRELSLLQEEAKDSKTRKNKKQGESNNENNSNELSPNDQEPPNPTANQPGSTSSNTPNKPPEASTATSTDEPANNKENLQGSGTKLLFRTKNGKYIVNTNEGVAGKRLKKVLKDLQNFLQANGYPGAAIKNNGIMRELNAATYPSNKARAKGSLHGSGLAIDLIFEIPGFKWRGIGDNGNLASNSDLVKTIWRWVQSQKDLTWGAEWGSSNPSNGNIKGYGITEFHHFEIKKDLIKNYWAPFTTELKQLGFNPDELTSTKKLQKLYEKLLA